MLLSLVFKSLSMLFFRKNLTGNNSFLKFLVGLLLFGNLFILAWYAFLQEIFGEDIFEALVFHFVFGVKGVGYEEYIIPTILFLTFISACIKSFKYFTIFLTGEKTNFTEFLFGLVLLSSSIYINPLFLDLNRFLTVSETSIDKDLFYDQKISYTKENKNVIFLYLEQIERTYLDQQLFPDLVPNISSLEEEAITFTDISIPKATNWTVGGMAASQCGVPLFTPIASQNSMSGVDKFMPLAKCAGDILNDAGYELHYMGGADTEFGGKGKFYATHGFSSIEGWKELRPKLENPNYRSPWGVYDDELLDLVLARAQSLNTDEKPFGLFALTLDTHHPNGYLSKSCSNKIYQDGQNRILNAVHCVDSLVGNFVRKFKNSSLYDSTILVVLSDHLALKNTATDLLNKGDRKNLFLIFGKGLIPSSFDQEGSLFDIGPTALGFVGTDTKGMALGRNLFFEESIERESLDEVIDNNKKRILELWSFPQITANLKVNTSEKIVDFGERFVEYPALILLDEDIQVSRIMFEFYYSLSLERHVKRLPSDQNYIWIDKCQIITGQQTNNEDCVQFKNSKTGASSVWRANNNVYSKEQLQSFFELTE